MRRLYKLRYNSHYDEEYEKTETNEINGQFRYLIPISELIHITQPIKVNTIQEKLDFSDLMDPNADAPFEQLTIRDLAAILLKKPVSTKDWLNKIITDK
jgi:hypothetical protein